MGLEGWVSYGPKGGKKGLLQTGVALGKDLSDTGVLSSIEFYLNMRQGKNHLN